MRLYACVAAFMLAPHVCAVDLIGGGLQVIEVNALDETRVAITVRERFGAERYVVDCIGATWGFESGAQSPVKEDRRSQAIAERACRAVEFKAALVSRPGAWLAEVAPQPRAEQPLTEQSLSSKPALKTTTARASFEECLAVRENVITQFSVSPRNIITILNTNLVTITRLCTVDGSVLISCSRPDEKMVITESPPDPTVGCPTS